METKILITVGIIFIVLVAIVIVFIVKKPSPPIPKEERFSNNLKDDAENDFLGTFFYIHNHLLKKIKVYVSNTSGKKVELVSIGPNSKVGLNRKTTMQSFTRDNQIHVYTLEHGLTPEKDDIENFFGTYELNIPEATTIKDFHIGMVTSRWVGSHGTEDVTPGANAVQGRSRVYIHNLTPNTLRLNYNIIIPPHNTLLYYGRMALGVALGTVFKNRDGLFKDFVYTIPASDVYYGITSDIEMPSFSGYQIDEKFTHNEQDLVFLMELGYMGGPAHTYIDPNYLPTEGSPIPLHDRWGQLITDKKEIKDDIHNNDRKPFLEDKLHVI